MTDLVQNLDITSPSFGGISTPHPGSRRDATAQAAEHETPDLTHEHGHQAAEPKMTLATRSDMPEESIPRTLTLSAANPYLAALPRDMRRRRAVLIPVDNDVILCETKELAQAVATLVAGGTAATALATGFYLPKGTPLPIESRDWMFAAATTTASTSRVSVLVERYALAVPE
jgi:hypothetical protein